VPKIPRPARTVRVSRSAVHPAFRETGLKALTLSQHSVFQSEGHVDFILRLTIDRHKAGLESNPLKAKPFV
jgi:hypothetical protein